MDPKPCPFCGGDTKTSNERFERTLLSWVYCTSCGSAGGYRNTEQEAIDAWNTRIERTCRIEEDWDYDGECPAYYRDYVCSECKEDFIYYKHSRISYCPNCGAKVVE